MATTQRAYQFGRLITSSFAGRASDSYWEAGLGESFAAKYGHPAFVGTGFCLPPRAAARDLLSTPASGAGDLIGESIAAVAQSVRPVTLMERAGMQVIETAGDFYHLPRWTTAAAGWIAENDAVPTLGTQVTTIDLSPRIAGARLAFSRRLSLLAEGIEQQVLAEVSRAVSSLIEKAVLRGRGYSSEPLGILNMPTKTKSFAAATPTFSELSDMLELLGDADADLSKLAWVLHPSDLRDLLIAEKIASTGEMILTWHDGQYRIFGVPAYATTNTVEGKVLLGDFSTVNLVFFGSPQLIVDKYSGGKSTNGQTEIILLNLCDAASSNPDLLCVGGV